MQRYEDNKIGSGLFAVNWGKYVLHSDAQAEINKLKEIVREYRKNGDNAEGGYIFHDECFVDDERKVDTRCATCRKADAAIPNKEQE